MLWWEHNGFWLFYKRIERGRLTYPSHTTEKMELTRDQLMWLLSGLDFTKQISLPAVKATHFY